MEDDSDMEDFQVKKRKIEKREDKPKQVKRVFEIPPFTHMQLAGMAMAVSANSGLCTNDVKEFIKNHFPYYRDEGTIHWTDMLSKILLRQDFVIVAEKARGRTPSIIRLDWNQFTSVAQEIFQVATERKRTAATWMKYPDKLDSFLAAVNGGVKFDIPEIVPDDGFDPKMDMISLIEETLTVHSLGLTRRGIIDTIQSLHPFYLEDSQALKLVTNVNNALMRCPVFNSKRSIAFGHNRRRSSVYEVDHSLKGLPLPSRIPDVPEQLGEVIKMAESLHLIGNSTGVSAKFFYEGEEDKLDCSRNEDSDDEDDDDVVTNIKNIKKIDVRIDNSPPGKYSQYLAYMTCLNPTQCDFRPKCFHYIFGASSMKYCSATQCAMSYLVSKASKEHKKYMSGDQQGKPPKVTPSCKGPLEFLRDHKDHEFGPTNCLSLWSTDVKEIRIVVKMMLRHIYDDISKAKSLSGYFTENALAVLESLYPMLTYRPEYITQQQNRDRLLNVPSRQIPIQIHVQFTKEELQILTYGGQVPRTINGLPVMFNC